MNLKWIIGSIIYRGLGIHLPESNNKINFGSRAVRAWCGKLMLDRCGKNINIEKGALFGKNISLGENSGIGINARLSSNIFIGNNVMMGPECTIYTQNHAFERTDIPMICQGFSDIRPVYIDDDVWIGGHVIILPGVRVGKGAVIGAGSVVTKNVPEYTIVAGNPAKIIKQRGAQSEQGS